MLPETNKIKEIAPGVYYVLLWGPESHILRGLLDPLMPYVLCWEHQVGNFTWREFHMPVTNPTEPTNVLSRIAKFDFILPTQRFLDVLPYMKPAIKAVQLNNVPPDYLDMRRIRGKQLYRILGECGWHVLLDTPANDYGQVLSPKREVLEQAIELVGKAEH
ncbi:MAG TPA: hypothetical protein VNO70_06355 [Blastocatellia bacterium]|nr:hypothetical protein [Blastocatellia bacterium]